MLLGDFIWWGCAHDLLLLCTLRVYSYCDAGVARPLLLLARRVCRCRQQIPLNDGHGHGRWTMDDRRTIGWRRMKVRGTEDGRTMIRRRILAGRGVEHRIRRTILAGRGVEHRISTQILAGRGVATTIYASTIPSTQGSRMLIDKYDMASAFTVVKISWRENYHLFI
jgi:hypothetical protein